MKETDTRYITYKSKCAWCGSEIVCTDVLEDSGHWHTETEHRCQYWDEAAELHARLRNSEL